MGAHDLPFLVELLDDQLVTLSQVGQVTVISGHINPFLQLISPSTLPTQSAAANVDLVDEWQQHELCHLLNYYAWTIGN